MKIIISCHRISASLSMTLWECGSRGAHRCIALPCKTFSGGNAFSLTWQQSRRWFVHRNCLEWWLDLILTSLIFLTVLHKSSFSAVNCSLSFWGKPSPLLSSHLGPCAALCRSSEVLAFMGICEQGGKGAETRAEHHRHPPSGAWGGMQQEVAELSPLPCGLWLLGSVS